MSVVKRSVKIAGHSTSITLEEPFWDALCDIAKSREMPVYLLIEEIDSERSNNNLSGAIRIFILQHIQKKLHDATTA